MGQIKKHHYILILIILLGLGLRLILINQSFWLDEAAQLDMSQQPVSAIWSGRDADFHPPLFYLLTHYWLNTGLRSEWVLRLLPIIFGVWSIFAIYLLATKLFSSRAGLISALILAINPFHIYYSQEMRSYSLICLFAIFSYLFLIRRQWLRLSLVNVLLIYTHYSTFFVPVSQIVFLAFYDRQHFSRYLQSVLITMVLYLPWIPRLLSQLSAGINIDQYLPGWRQLLTLPTFKSLPFILFKFTAGKIDIYPRYVYYLYGGFVLAVVTTGFIWSKKMVPLLSTWLFVPIFGSMALSLFIPQTQPFRLIFTLPALCIYLSLAVLNRPKTFLTLLIYISIVGNFMYFTRPRLQREQWRQAVAYLNQTPSSPVIVKFSDSFAPMKWYGLKNPIIPSVLHFPAQPNQISSALTDIPGQVFVVEYLGTLTDPRRLVERTVFTSGLRETSGVDFPGVGIIREYKRL